MKHKNIKHETLRIFELQNYPACHPRKNGDPVILGETEPISKVSSCRDIGQFLCRTMSEDEVALYARRGRVEAVMQEIGHISPSFHYFPAPLRYSSEL